MRTPSTRVSILVTLTSLALAGVAMNACAGKTSGVSSSDADASTTSDGGPGPRPADCPTSEPAQDGACQKEGLLCEYGDDFNPMCNTVHVCSGGRWASPIYYGSRPKCPTQIPTVPPNPSDCPATLASVPSGQSCSSKSTCTYDGAICTCGVYCPEYPIRMPDCDPDAGRTTSCCDTTKVQWHCFTGPSYCTLPRPRVGSACAKEGDSCALSPPVECGQDVLACQKGVWNMENNSCPVSTARAKHDISYLDDADVARLHDDAMRVKLATYRYKNGDEATHLGFIIEDMPQGSPAVLATRDRVDLYGYVSMAVASMQQQQKRIDALEAEVARLRAEREAHPPRAATRTP